MVFWNLSRHTSRPSRFCPIRPHLAAAIAATGAIYETANGDLVQVVAPFASLEALAALPDVRMVRLPYPAGR